MSQSLLSSTVLSGGASINSISMHRRHGHGSVVPHDRSKYQQTTYVTNKSMAVMQPYSHFEGGVESGPSVDTSFKSMLTIDTSLPHTDSNYNASSYDGDRPLKELAQVRWSVEKRRQEYDREMKVFRARQNQRMRFVQIKSDHYTIHLHEKVFFSIRWAYPPFASVHEKLLLDYCEHLLGPTPELPFKSIKVLEAWNEKCRATKQEKACAYVYSLVMRLRNIVTKRDSNIVNINASAEKKLVSMGYKRDAELAWKMQRLRGQRDRYWSLWFLAANGLVVELNRLLNESPLPKEPARYLTVSSQMSRGDTTIKTRHPVDVDDPDPDFGLCAIHYAAKKGHIPIIKLLLRYGSDINVRAADGRTALHFAAAYSNKETVRCLLAELADYYAVDDYKCTALDLARQNNNVKTIPTLERWITLTSSDQEGLQQTEEIDETPPEFTATPAHVKQLMSKQLQILCSRLDGEERATSKGIVKLPGVLDPNILVRLCDKHSMMCLEQGFDKEGIKTLLRRWRVSNNLYLSYKASMAELEVRKQLRSEQERLDADSQLVELVPQHDDVDRKAPSSLKESHAVSTANDGEDLNVNNVNVLSTSSSLSILTTPLPAVPSPTSPSPSKEIGIKERHTPPEVEAETFDDMFSEEKGYIIPEGKEGDDIRRLGEAIIMRKNKKAAIAAARAREALEATRRKDIDNDDNTTKDKEDSKGVTASTKDQKDRDELRQLDVPTEQVIMTSKALCDVGREVAERLVMDGQERLAMSILLDCAVLDGLEPTTVVAVLIRYAEIGVVVVDLYAHLLRGRLDYRGKGMKDSFEDSIKEDLSIYTTADVFQQSNVVTYLNTLRRYREGEKKADKLNIEKERKRVAKSSKIKAARNDVTTEQLLYREAQRIRRRVSAEWMPRPYGNPVFKTDEAVQINEQLKEPQVDPMHEKLDNNELLSEEILLHTLGRHVETAIEAVEKCISITERLSIEEGSAYIVESHTLAPQLELLSILLERRADLVEMGDTLAFISIQEATGLWGAALVCTAECDTKDETSAKNHDSSGFLPSVHDDDKPRETSIEHKKQQRTLPTLDEKLHEGGDDDMYIDRSELQERRDAMQQKESENCKNIDLVSDKLRSATDPLYWQYQDIREGRTDYKFAHYLSIDQIIASLQAMQHASVVSERVNGPSAEVTVQYMLEVLRLLIRASTWSPISMLEAAIRDQALTNGPSVSEIHEFSSFISSRLDNLSHSNPEALHRLTRRYADLMSISRIFQETGGNILPPVSTIPERYDVKKRSNRAKNLKTI